MHFQFIEGVIISLNLLKEASLVVINALNIFKYASFNSINTPIHTFLPERPFFWFYDRWSLFRCPALFQCNVHFCYDFFLVRNVFLSASHMLCMTLFLFIALIPLSLRTIFPSIFVFYFFYTLYFFFILFLLFIYFYHFPVLISIIVHYVHAFLSLRCKF
jgi:hypothetical protein